MVYKKLPMMEKYCKLLKEYNITQQELSKKMGVTKMIVCRYLSGIRNITPKASRKIYNALLEIAKEREIDAIKLQMELEKIQESI